MDIIHLLKKDHQEMRDVMDKLEKNSNQAKGLVGELFKKFKELYAQHDKAEEDIIYPALSKVKELAKFSLKGYQAHHMVEVGILELKLLPFGSESWGPKFSVIRDSILTHMDEEEKLLFPEMTKYFEKDKLSELAAQVEKQRA